MIMARCTACGRKHPIKDLSQVQAFLEKHKEHQNQLDYYCDYVFRWHYVETEGLPPTGGLSYLMYVKIGKGQPELCLVYYSGKEDELVSPYTLVYNPREHILAQEIIAWAYARELKPLYSGG